MVKVVILGGGFAGIAAAKALLLLCRQKNTDRSKVQITLVDKNSYHLFTPSLYEVATAEETTKNICIPLHEILKGVELVKGEVQKIDKDKVHLNNRTIDFDYLIIALGSESAYYNIPGLKENSISFKTLEDAVKIKNSIKKSSKIVIGGGGFSGTELVCELVRHKKGAEITIISGSECLLKELDTKISRKAGDRLGSSVNIVCGEHIKSVDPKNVYTDSGKYPYDVLIWTGGVQAVSFQSDFEKDKRGDLIVNDKLQISNSKNIFAAGDIATGYPWVAQIAEDEGETAGENVANLISNSLRSHDLKQKALVSYKFKHLGYIVPLGGHFAAVQIGKIVFIGFLGWILEQIVLLRYLLSILPITKAFKRWNRFEEYLMK